MDTLVVGDRLIPHEAFRAAIERELGGGFGPVRAVDWAAPPERQHSLQQTMETDGPEAVPTPDEVVAAAGEAELLVVHFAPVPLAVLEAAPRLAAVVVARAGVENVNLDEASRRGVAVANVQGRNAAAVAEQALALLLAEVRDVARADAGIKAGGWPKEFAAPAWELAGRTVAMVGFGHVARQLARRLAGFGVRLLVFDPYVDRDTIDAHGGEKLTELDQAFREGDVVSLHARLSAETRRFIGREQFALMKPTAYFVNTARSRMVDHDALYQALAEHRIAGAGLDVHDQEPLPPDSPWRALDNVTLSPHIAGATVEAREKSVRLVAEAVRELAERGHTATVVNADAVALARQ